MPTASRASPRASIPSSATSGASRRINASGPEAWKRMRASTNTLTRNAARCPTRSSRTSIGTRWTHSSRAASQRPTASRAAAVAAARAADPVPAAAPNTTTARAVAKAATAAARAAAKAAARAAARAAAEAAAKEAARAADGKPAATRTPPRTPRALRDVGPASTPRPPVTSGAHSARIAQDDPFRSPDHHTIARLRASRSAGPASVTPRPPVTSGTTD